jgi:alpha-D-ribose 1-methylphosphonate 5-triphosphate diphosphatase PhnM
MPEAPRTGRTRTCEFVVDRYIHARFLPGAEVTLDDAKQNIAMTGELGGGVALPALIDLRDVRSQSAEARAYLAGPEAARVSNAVALLVASPLTKVLGNFYLGFNRPETPTRIFGSTEEAEAWLAGFLAEP